MTLKPGTRSLHILVCSLFCDSDFPKKIAPVPENNPGRASGSADSAILNVSSGRVRTAYANFVRRQPRSLRTQRQRQRQRHTSMEDTQIATHTCTRRTANHTANTDPCKHHTFINILLNLTSKLLKPISRTAALSTFFVAVRLPALRTLTPN